MPIPKFYPMPIPMPILTLEPDADSDAIPIPIFEVVSGQIIIVYALISRRINFISLIHF